MNNKYLSNSIMNMDLNEEIRETNDEFVNILRQLPNRRLKKQLKKQLTKERKIGEKKALQSVKNIFDENKQLKAELREIKKSKKETLNKIKELKKKQTKYQRDVEVRQLKQEKKELLNKIKEHAGTKLIKEEKTRRRVR